MAAEMTYCVFKLNISYLCCLLYITNCHSKNIYIHGTFFISMEKDSDGGRCFSPSFPPQTFTLPSPSLSKLAASCFAICPWSWVLQFSEGLTPAYNLSEPLSLISVWLFLGGSIYIHPAETICQSHSSKLMADRALNLCSAVSPERLSLDLIH